MATVYGNKVYNTPKGMSWRVYVEYSGSSATLYGQVISEISGTSGNLWVRFGSPKIGSTTFSDKTGTYATGSSVKLGTATISPSSSTSFSAKCTGGAWGQDGTSSGTIPVQQYTNTISHWTWGYVNGEGNNGAHTAFKIGEDTINRNAGVTSSYTTSLAKTIPNGFYLDDTFGSSSFSSEWQRYSFPYSFTQNKNTSAQYDYRPTTYNITYNLDGGTNNANNPSTYNVLYGVTFSNPTKTGYDFSHWTIDGTTVTGINPGANATFSSPTDLYDKTSARTTGDKTAVAHWTPQQYYLTINGWLDGTSTSGLGNYGTADVYINGSLVASQVSSYHALQNYGSTYEISNITPTTGHVYNGVHSGSIIGTIGLADTEVVLDFSTKTYTISYDAGASSPSSQTKTHGVDITLENAITKADTTADGFRVEFDANGGTVSPSELRATNTISYSFNKWEDQQGTQYSGGGTYSKDLDNTLIPIWNTSTTYGSITTPTATRSNGTSTRTVTFDATTNGGTCPTASLNSSATITYTSDGWYSLSTGGVKRCSNGGSYTPAADEQVFNHWVGTTGTYSVITLPAATKSSTTSTRTVTFDANGGVCSTASLDSTATTVYTQTGWFTGSSSGTSRGNATDTYTPTESETLYAQFSSSSSGYSVITLPSATRDGYIFKGWAESSSATTGTTGAYTPASSLTLYAVWEIDQATVWYKNSQGTWVKGKVWYKNNQGTWVKAKKFYVKENNNWVENKTTS